MCRSATIRSLWCGRCGCKTEHNVTTGVLVRIGPRHSEPCDDCERWAAGRPPARAKRPGES